ncbi:helix-turn-helix domain-containing protein [Nocardia sp. NPDC101769]|uniref:helix-turn-helix domain-containing protein n=1 Tax=Nocardia sp. NPDC101769 TaxID=3364333 RepID=UPI003825382F
MTRPDESVSSIARLLGVSRSTIYQYVPEIGTGRGQLGAGEDPPLTDVGEYDELLPSRALET